MDDESRAAAGPETQSSLESTVQESVKQRQEQLEPPTPKTVMEKVDSLTRTIRQKAQKFADNKIVKWIPVVSPLINYGLDMQKASTALVQGKDIDTGMKVSGKERAKMVVANFGKALWDQTLAGGEVALLAVGGTAAAQVGEKVAGKVGGFVAERTVPGAVKGGLDKLEDFVRHPKGGLKPA